MSKARQLADLLDSNGDVVVGALDNVPPSNDASALTTGTLDAARIADGSVANAKLASDLDASKVTTGTLPVDRVPYLGRRNLIINGAMQVAQRGTSFSGITNSGSKYTLDRFRVAEGGTTDGVVTASQSTDAPDEFGSSLKLEVTTAQSSVSSTHNFRIEQRLEGQNLQSLASGTSSAKNFTLSFWVKSSVTGTYAVSFYNIDSLRIIGATYTINSANTWEKKTLTFAGDTVGTYDNDNGYSLLLTFALETGTDLKSTDNSSWINYVSTAYQYGQEVDWLTNAGATFYITGVQLEVGSVATPFEHRSYGEELALCQRYCETVHNYGDGLVTNNLILSSTYATTSATVHIWFKTPKRTSNPDLTYTQAGDGGTASLYGKSGDYFSLYSASDTAFYLYDILVEDEL